MSARQFMPPTTVSVRVIATGERIELPCDCTVFDPPAGISDQGTAAAPMDAPLVVPTTMHPRKACDAGGKGTLVMIPLRGRYELAEVEG